MTGTSVFRKVVGLVIPPPAKSDDGRDQWPSRASFLLAAMGGCAGMGNLIRYPSVFYNNAGLQWFLPYFLCVVLIAIPVLILEIAVGQAYRGGSVVAFNNIHHRLKGLGFSLLYIGFIVGPYFVVNLSWIMIYFRNSFKSELPWAGREEEYFYQDVVANIDAIPGEKSGGSVVSYTSYPGTALIGETVGWTAFIWFLVWFSIFRGVGMTGRVVYFTMGLPVVMTIIIIGRAASLPDSIRGVRLFLGTWHSDKLATGQVWQRAAGQVFFSTGVGFGYFTSYASYNARWANAVMDSVLICGSNVLFENVAAFAPMSVVGHLNMIPDPDNPIGAFSLGFMTLPAVTASLPGAQFWSFALFFTLVVLGYSSAFAMLDAVVTLIMDSGVKWRREWVVTALVILSFLISLPYCTEFGYALLSGIDQWINNVALVFVVMCEAALSTTFYRWRDVVGQVGAVGFWMYQFGYFGGMVLGVTVAQAVSAEAGAGVGFGIYIAFGIVGSCLLGKTPDSVPPRFFQKQTRMSNIVGKIPGIQSFTESVYFTRFWYVAFYSGQQLRLDLNAIVANGKNWAIPFFWGPLLRYVAAPALAIIFSFAYPDFYAVREDPLHILGFIIAHICLLLIGAGIIGPRWFNSIIPPTRREEGKFAYAPNVVVNVAKDNEENSLENADSNQDSSIEPKGDLNSESRGDSNLESRQNNLGGHSNLNSDYEEKKTTTRI